MPLLARCLAKVKAVKLRWGSKKFH